MKRKLWMSGVAAMLFAAALPMTALAARGGWVRQSNEQWMYRYADGTYAADEWQRSGDGWYYLGSDGVMVTNALIETDDDRYYVDETGACVYNAWHMAEDEEGELRWYYFGKTGKAQKAPSSGKVSTVVINGKRYAFDDDGRMLYGWVNGDSAELTDEDDESAWIEADYYFNGPEDGSAAVGWKQLHVVDNDEDQIYWFYFNDSGKKNRSRKTIDGVSYTFDTGDGHMLTGWAAAENSGETGSITPDSAMKYFNNDGSAAKNSWIWAVADEDYIKEDYDDDTYSWWYTNNSGKVYTDQIKKINGKRYAFDFYGRMLTDFVTTDEDGHNVAMVCWDEEMTERRLFSEKYPILYFCTNTVFDGAVQTGYQNITIDDGPRQFWFNASGIGTTGYISKIGKFTVSGMVLCADTDEGRYAGVLIKNDADGYELDESISGLYYKDNIPADGSCVLVNKTGAIQKNKKNMKDDDLYFCTDEKGRVIYVDYEKAE